MPLFRVVQASGEIRSICNARRRGHNEVTSEDEIISAPSVGFIPEAITTLLREIAEGAWSEASAPATQTRGGMVFS